MCGWSRLPVIVTHRFKLLNGWSRLPVIVTHRFKLLNVFVEQTKRSVQLRAGFAAPFEQILNKGRLNRVEMLNKAY